METETATAPVSPAPRRGRPPKAQVATESTQEPAEPAIPAGHVMVRVLPKGHGKIHTGENVLVVVEPTPELEAIRRLPNKRENYEILEKAEAKAFLDASVSCGQTYPKGKRFTLPERMAMQLEDKGFVEIEGRDEEE